MYTKHRCRVYGFVDIQAAYVRLFLLKIQSSIKNMLLRTDDAANFYPQEASLHTGLAVYYPCILFVLFLRSFFIVASSMHAHVWRPTPIMAVHPPNS